MQVTRLIATIALVALALLGAVGTRSLVTVRADCVGLECSDQPSCGRSCFCNTSGDGTCHSNEP